MLLGNHSIYYLVTLVSVTLIYIVPHKRRAGFHPSPIEFVIKKTNKGRKRKRDVEEESDDDNNSHNKFSSDNLKTKIQVHYISFLISYVNFFLDYFGFTEKFFDIDHKKKRDVKKKNFSLLKETPIGKILSENISQKLTTQQNKEINKSIYQKVINNPIINNLLSENMKHYLKMYIMKVNQL